MRVAAPAELDDEVEVLVGSPPLPQAASAPPTTRASPAETTERRAPVREEAMKGVRVSPAAAGVREKAVGGIRDSKR